MHVHEQIAIDLDGGVKDNYSKLIRCKQGYNLC